MENVSYRLSPQIRSRLILDEFKSYKQEEMLFQLESLIEDARNQYLNELIAAQKVEKIQ